MNHLIYKNKNMRHLIARLLWKAAAFTFILGIAWSCNPEEWDPVDCSECYTVRPDEAQINVRLTINRQNPSVTINIYSGRIEEEILVASETVTTESWSIILPADAYYTVAATYNTHYHPYVTAIDGNLVRTEKVRTICNEPCWRIQGNNFNVRLRY